MSTRPEDKPEEPSAKRPKPTSPNSDSSTPSSASEVKTGSSSSNAIDLTMDYGIPHYLYLYYIPSVPVKVKPRLDTLMEEIRDWHCYEVAVVEKELNDQTGPKQLPTDSSVTSRITRSSERAKYLSWVREVHLYW